MTAKIKHTAGAVTKFRLLMWKNFLQQWRHRIQTVTELLLPAVTMLLILILRWQIEPAMMDTRTYPPLPAHTLEFSTTVLGGMNITDLSIAYSPQSEILEDVVRSATARLLLRNAQDLIPVLQDLLQDLIPPELILPNATDVYEVLRRIVRVTAYNNSAELRGIYAVEETTRNVLAAVEFNDSLFGASSLPNDLSYALRFPERPRQNSFFNVGGRSWRTDNVFPSFEIAGPRFPHSWEGGNNPGYVNEMFIALQHAVSNELITRATGQDISNFTINIRRYPHPPYIEDHAKTALQFLFPMFILLCYSYSAVNIVRAVTLENELQLKDMMKIMGLPTWLHWSAWFCKQFLFLSVSAILIVFILKIRWFTNEHGFGDYAVFTNTPWTVLFFFIILYLTCVICFCFMLSSFFSKANTASLTAGVIWYVTYVPAVLLAMDVEMSAGVQGFTCLSINSAMSYGFQLILAKEGTGGMHWGDFLRSPTTDSTRFLFGHVVIMLAVDSVLYMLIALYTEQVFPGPYGTPKPWYFPFQKQFWCTGSSSDDGFVNENIHEHDITMEKDPRNHKIGVKITNLTKIFGKTTAVNNLNLNIYDDQITVLLGHNGAGKSTTLSMLTGNLPVTRGSVTLAGYDVSKQTRAARAHLGVCPQHNVLFDELSVREHLLFFARLKGYRGEALNYEVDSLIDKLELQDKRDYLAGGLSGGQKRRLSVGIALSGGARVLLLDEPTSGMDPASRRALWDLLQQEKKDRSMILTTHFMDEADILGDRVAIMAQGRLQCVGSPYFLKQHYGVGYTLVVVKDIDFEADACTELIRKYIPEISIKEDRGTEVTYPLSNEDSYKFEKMLNDLESNINSIKFTNYGLVATTLEDVFMSVGSDLLAQNSSDIDESVEIETVSVLSQEDKENHQFESSVDKLNVIEDSTLTGFRLFRQHVLAVWLKLWLVWTRSWQLLTLQVIVPLLQINATLGVLQYITSFVESVQRRKLSLSEGYTRTETLVHYNDSDTTLASLGAMAYEAYHAIFLNSSIPSMDITVVDNPIDEYYMLRTTDLNMMNTIRNQILIGATFSNDTVTAWFSNFGYHDVATSLAAVQEALLKALIPSATMTVYNHPLEANYRNDQNMEVMVSMLSMQLTSGIASSLGMLSAVYVMFYIKERTSRAKLLQKASGIKPVVMWASAAIFDWVWFMILCMTIIISLIAFKVVGFSTFFELGRLYACFMVYGFAMLPLHYLVSYNFNGPAVGFVVMFFVNVLIGMMGPQIVDALWTINNDTERVAKILDSILQFFPLYSLSTSARMLNKLGLMEWTCMEGCDYLLMVMPNVTECTMEAMCNVISQQCCIDVNAHWEWNDPGVMRYITCMFASGAVLWIVLMVAEYRLVQKIFNREKKAPQIDKTALDSDVVNEENHVKAVGTGLGGQTLVASGLTKYYGKNLAVDQVSFTVSEDECFGLLGVNGAGKTTTFKMLMGDETISSGDAYVAGHSVKTDITNVYKNIGYCPQFDAIFGEMTGRETLRFFSMLRGLTPDYTVAQTTVLAQALGFTKHLDKRVDHYSGGNKRKLSTAVALLGRTRLLFVDEPTTGVDPAAKRQVWTAIRRARREGRGVVLTSHSMEECEALCSRLTIMVNGRFQCLGTPQHLKHKFSQGFTLTVKMKIEDTRHSLTSRLSSCETPHTPTAALKNFIHTNFREPKIMEEYQGLLTYYLPDRTVPWSQMFGIMERAKSELNVEDYTISQTTLEQIFLQFTKYQRNES